MSGAIEKRDEKYAHVWMLNGTWYPNIVSCERPVIRGELPCKGTLSETTVIEIISNLLGQEYFDKLPLD